MGDYRVIKEELLKFLQTARGEDYDAVYYYIGKYDFDQNNPEALNVVADLILEKATIGKAQPYKAERKPAASNFLYKDIDVALENVSRNIAKRVAAEHSSQDKGMVYIPESNRFNMIVCAAASETSVEDIERKTQKRNTFCDMFVDGLKRQLRHPVREIGIGWLVFYAFVLIYIVIELIY